MSDHNEEVKVSAPSHVAPPNKESKQLILQQHVKEIKEETAKAKTSYAIIGCPQGMAERFSMDK